MQALGPIIHSQSTSLTTNRRSRGSLNVPDPLPADVTYTIECSNSLGSGATWTPIATGTAAGGWSGEGAITEDAPADGRRIIQVRDIQGRHAWDTPVCSIEGEPVTVFWMPGENVVGRVGGLTLFLGHAQLVLLIIAHAGLVSNSTVGSGHARCELGFGRQVV